MVDLMDVRMVEMMVDDLVDEKVEWMVDEKVDEKVDVTVVQKDLKVLMSVDQLE